jgi:hypothetical protein
MGFIENDYEGLQGEMLERLEEKKRKLQDEYDNFELGKKRIKRSTW